MIDDHINNPKSPKYYVTRFLESKKAELKGKTVLDFPAGNGATTEILLQLGADVKPFDLFPEYFLVKDIECRRADIMDKIPVVDSHADWVICQEGIEHFSNQAYAFKEFNRVMKPGGTLIITCPSYSNLASRLSYLLFESETNKRMPPNEIDDIWMSDKTVSTEIYHGHIFLIGLQKLRILAKLAGFKITSVNYVRLSKGSLLLFPFFYPFIFLSSWYRYLQNRKKHPEIPFEQKKLVYKEQLKLNISPKNLLSRHTFMIFEKENHLEDINFRLESKVKHFGKIM